MSSPLSVVKKKKLSKLNSPSSLTRSQDKNDEYVSSNPYDYIYKKQQKEYEIGLKDDKDEEARSRLAQMEKSMQWYSECTTNWREKWNKVKHERNKAKEESRMLRNRIESLNKDMLTAHREKAEMANEIVELKNKILEYHIEEIKSSNNILINEEENIKINNKDETNDTKLNNLSIDEHVKDKFNTLLSFNTNDKNNDSLNIHDHSSLNLKITCQKSKSVNFSQENQHKSTKNLQYRIVKLELKLEEANKLLENERKEKNKLIENMDKLKLEHNSLRYKYSDRKKKNLLNNNKKDNEDNKKLNTNNIEEEENNPFIKLLKIKNELENLLSFKPFSKNDLKENEEFINEAKKLYEQTIDGENKLIKIKENKDDDDSHELEEIKSAFQEVNKELIDVKQRHNQLKKVYQDKCTELANSIKRSEQLESENKKLRIKIEEMKKDLSSFEDELDLATNTIRKLQETNVELEKENENYQLMSKDY